jgi:hypothetical protein
MAVTFQTVAPGAVAKFDVGDCSERWFSCIMQYFEDNILVPFSGNVSFGDCVQWNTGEWNAGVGTGFPNASYDASKLPASDDAEPSRRWYVFSFYEQCVQGKLSVFNNTNKSISVSSPFTPRTINTKGK